MLQLQKIEADAIKERAVQLTEKRFSCMMDGKKDMLLEGKT